MALPFRGFNIRHMAARDRFEISLECPKCGSQGVAKVSENDYPFMRNPGFEVDSLPSGFKVIEHSNFRNKTKVGCECGEAFFL